MAVAAEKRRRRPIARSTGARSQLRIVGDATGAVRPAGEIELVAAAVAQPAIQQALVEPGTPAPLHGHAQAELHDADKHAPRQQRQVE